MYRKLDLSPPSLPPLPPSPQEGEAYLQSQGLAVTDDDVKTRGQKEKLEEIKADKPQVKWVVPL